MLDDQFFKELWREAYRGQIVQSLTRKGVPATTEPIVKEDGQFDPYYKFGDYFSQQIRTYEFLRQGKNVFLESPFYSGRTTIAALFALDVIFNRHQSVLFIFPNEYEKKTQERWLKCILREINYDWLVDIWHLDTKDSKEVPDPKRPGIFPSLFITEIKDLHSHFLPHYQKYDNFWQTLGLLVFDDFEKFSGNLASNLKFMLKRLYAVFESMEQNPQFLVLSKPFSNSINIIQEIFGLNFELIHKDTNKIMEANILFWVPPINHVNISYKEETRDTFADSHIQREPFLAEAYDIAIRSIASGITTVIYYAGIPFSENDLRQRETEIDNAIRGMGGSIPDAGKWVVGSDLGDITARLYERSLKWDKVNCIVVAGFSGTLNNLRDDILHLGAENATIFVVLPQLPYYQFYINDPKEMELITDVLEIAKGEKLPIFIFNPDNESIRKKHFSLFLLETKDSPKDFREKLIKKCWIGAQLKDIETFEKDAPSILDRVIALGGMDIASSDIETLYTVNAGNHIIKTADIEEIPDLLFPHAVLCENNNRYKIIGIDPQKRLVRAEGESDFRITFSMREMHLKELKIIDKLGFSKSGKSITFSTARAEVKAEIERYKEISDLDVDNIKINQIKKQSYPSFQLDVLEISEVPRNIVPAFAHLFFIALRTRFFIANAIYPRFFIHKHNIYFYHSGLIGSGLFKTFLSEVTVRDLLQRGFALLLDCPCEKGCPGCLKIVEALRDDKDLNKVELIEFLGSVLGCEKEAVKFIQLKSEKVDDNDHFGQVKNKVLDILNHKSRLIIQNEYNYALIPEKEADSYPGIAGLCDHLRKRILIKPVYKEEQFVGIVAHEYVHNWQHEDNLHSLFKAFNHNDIDDPNNILFAGKLFVEGQAMWGEYKVLDYFGIKDVIYENEVAHYAEYKEGAMLLNYLEKKFGIYKMLEILKTASINGKPMDPTILNQWYRQRDEKGKESGVYASIIEAGKKLIEQGHLKCLTKAYLDKLEDIQRISFFMAQMSNPIGTRLSDLLESKIGDFRIRKTQVVWDHLKKLISEVNPTGSLVDELPCLTCEFSKSATIENICILFKGAKEAEEIKKKIEEIRKEEGSI